MQQRRKDRVGGGWGGVTRHRAKLDQRRGRPSCLEQGPSSLAVHRGSPVYILFVRGIKLGLEVGIIECCPAK